MLFFTIDDFLIKKYHRIQFRDKVKKSRLKTLDN